MNQLSMLKKEVQEAQDRLDRAKLRERLADELCIHTALSDPSLPRYRDESVKAGNAVADAEDELTKAQIALIRYKQSV